MKTHTENNNHNYRGGRPYGKDKNLVSPPLASATGEETKIILQGNAEAIKLGEEQ